MQCTATLTFFITILLSGNLFAQTDGYDTLKMRHNAYLESGEADSALFMAKQMNQWALQHETDTSLRYAVSFRLIGNSFYRLGMPDSAMAQYIHSLEILEQQDRTEYKDYASSLNNLGNLYIDLGDYPKAEAYCLQSLAIRKKVFGEEHVDYAMSLHSLGLIYKNLGDFAKAEAYSLQSLAIRKKVLGQEHIDYAMSLNNLGTLYYDLGDYYKAEAYCLQSLEIRKKVLGEEHVDYATSLNNLGVIYRNLGDYQKAEAYYLQSLEIKKKVLGEEHVNYPSSLNNLGVLYKNLGDYSKAEAYSLQSLEIRKKVLGEEHVDYAMSLHSLGLLYSGSGDYPKAEAYFLQCVEIYKKVLGEEHPKFLMTQLNVAEVFMKTERFADAYAIYTAQMDSRSRQINTAFEWMSERQKEAYWESTSSFFNAISSFSSSAFQQVPEVSGTNYNAVLYSRSKLLEGKVSRENFFRDQDELRQELQWRYTLLVKLESDGSDEYDRMKVLQHEIDSLDKALMLSWPAYKAQKERLSIQWQDVQQQLSPQEAAIEFVRYKNEDDSLYYYHALVLRSDYTYPQLVPLCQEAALEQLNPESDYTAYYSLIWAPLDSLLTGVNTIYYSPTGELYNVPFHALYSPNPAIIQEGNRTLIAARSYLMDQYTLHQLTSTRYLALDLKKKAQEPIKPSLAIAGGINYDFLPNGHKSEEQQREELMAYRSSGIAGDKLLYLVGTKKELDAVKRTTSSTDWRVTALEFNAATEERITQMINEEAPSILHLATHGYAFPAYDGRDTTVKQNSLRYSYRYNKNPMVRSGLILAGGNYAWTGNDTLVSLGYQNGILTALEVSLMDLRQTKLVVLSACETGLGSIEGTEGIFGLKRGFKLAGVEELIVSLWSVPDEATNELMTLFYEELSDSRKPVAAFEYAQATMRQRYPLAPEKWAGFVLVR